MVGNHEQIVNEVNREFECLHEKTEIRKKTDSAGRPIIARQCIKCRLQQGSYLSPRQYNVQNLPEWDNKLENAFHSQRGDAMRDRFGKEKEREKKEFLKRHDAYLKSEVWQKLRQKILNRANGICEGCGEAKATQVHHMNYERWGGNELLIDLLAVCGACHQKLHPKDRDIVDVLIESQNLPMNNRGKFFDA